jgi:hypothetical protein
VRLGRPSWYRLIQYWTSNIESGRPGFAAELRIVARDALGSSDLAWVEKGIAALAVVGQTEDLELLAECGVHHGGSAAINVRTAMFEIKHRG